MKVAERAYKFLQAGKDKRWNILYGGVSSSKSWAVAQYLLIEKLMKEKEIGVLALRKVRPALKDSCWRLMNYWIRKLNLSCQINRSDLLIHFPNGNFIQFNGLDNVEKKKSLEGINYIWLEETTEFTHREFLQLNLRCRAQNSNGINQLYLSFNPIDPIGNEWLKDISDAGTYGDQQVLMLNHNDNPFLSAEEHAQIEALADQDVEYDKIYRLGQWATPTNLIYSNWDTVEQMPERYDERVWGLDFGYSSNEAALVELRFVGDEIYEREHLYMTNLTNPQLIELLKEAIEIKTDMIVADCAEPKSIQEISNAGLNVHPCKKGADSVRHGINTVKSFHCHVTIDSTNLIREKKGYKWKVNKDDIPLPEPVPLRNHLMDAERYAIQKVRGKVEAGVSFVGVASENVDVDPVFDDRYWKEN